MYQFSPEKVKGEVDVARYVGTGLTYFLVCTEFATFFTV